MIKPQVMVAIPGRGFASGNHSLEYPLNVTSVSPATVNLNFATTVTVLTHNSQPSTLDPLRSTLNPEPSTLNPQP
jgi:hypothetical protein